MKDPEMGPREDLRWNSDPTSCAQCGRRVEEGKGYRVYDTGGEAVLCADCYQNRMQHDAGGSTGDLTAEVDGGSG